MSWRETDTGALSLDEQMPPLSLSISSSFLSLSALPCPYFDPPPILFSPMGAIGTDCKVPTTGLAPYFKARLPGSLLNVSLTFHLLIGPEVVTCTPNNISFILCKRLM